MGKATAWIVVGVVVSVLTACGGGGGSNGTPRYGSDSANPASKGTVPGTAVEAVPTSLSFVSVTPEDKPLIVQGATANGRSDTATLQFRLLDQGGNPVAGEGVQFNVVPSNQVTLNYSKAVTDSNGYVTASVTAKSQPTTVVIKAVLVSNSAIGATSNLLSVTGGDPFQAGFQIVSDHYNLDGNFIGDTAKISAYVRDTFGNPVPKGFAVSFTTDLGSVGGQCQTDDAGQCSVTFTVQNPRVDVSGGSTATVRATGALDDGTILSNVIHLNLAGAGGSGYRLMNGGVPVSSLALSACKQDVVFQFDDGTGKAPARNSTIEVIFASNGASASIKYGSPVADALDGAYTPPPVVVSFDLSNLSSSPCGDGNANTTSTQVYFKLSSPNGVQTSQVLDLSYPL